MASEIGLYGYSSEESYDLAKNYINSRTKIYIEAIANGYEVDDASVYDKIALLREDICKVDNYSDYLAFINGTGMTEDEY